MREKSRKKRFRKKTQIDKGYLMLGARVPPAFYSAIAAYADQHGQTLKEVIVAALAAMIGVPPEERGTC